MFIRGELNALEENLLDQASLKEKAFYLFLTDKPISYPLDEDLSEIQQICLSQFCLESPSKKSEIERIRKAKPIMGMHYANNLIELFAISLSDPKAEKGNLKTYCNNHSTRDFFVLSTKFRGYCTTPPEPKNATDKIAMHLFEGSSPENWTELFGSALQEASDLIDTFVLGKAYLVIMNEHPMSQKLEDLTFANENIEKLLTLVENKIQRRVAYSVSIPAIVVAVWTAYWAITNWDKAEPIAYVVQAFFFLLALIVFFFTGMMPDKLEFFKKYKNRIVDSYFRKMGIDLKELKRRIGLQK